MVELVKEKNLRNCNTNNDGIVHNLTNHTVYVDDQMIKVFQKYF